jgi:integral membrane protein
MDCFAKSQSCPASFDQMLYVFKNIKVNCSENPHSAISSVLSGFLMLSKIAIIEGSTLLLLLFLAVPAKRLYGYPEAVTLMGSIHGAAFIIYVVTLVAFFAGKNLNLKQLGMGLFAAFIPFGSFAFEHYVLKPQKL